MPSMLYSLLKTLLFALALILVLALVLIWFALFSSRPPLSTDPAVFAGDGSQLDYCELPPLSGDGKFAKDIPKGNTPGCGYERFPMPILAECTEPLAPGADDIRGLWEATDGRLGHVERIEQCGSRVVVTAAGIIHDAGPNSSAGLTTDDTEGDVIFVRGDKEYCPRTSAAMVWNDGVLDFHVFGWGPVVVKRYMDRDQLVWEYADGSVTRMKRICRLPDAHRVPAERGTRYALPF